ncbi:hypothetical protein [Amycolatopsis sp. FDAARGOS 1241]|uniref:hypothetical protein n=1 Tax=Amycolatopsis sp. FDAARGOS 1241 TaxID=2778070 RepID=UPI00194F0D08|nr:hypothetical protein [Amycolatopsis sp. FDAARGOS 1241]QRP49524.1 hypothetical protein I6J71_18250 [Amycolatopsis sp. FDAARGOS 1241]
MTESTELARTRRSLHGVAELLLAGPQFRSSGRIELRVVGEGFATIAEPALTVDGPRLVTPSGAVDLPGRTYREVAAEIGVEAGDLADVYSDGPGVRPDETIELGAGALSTLLRAFAAGDRALRAFAPGETPVLWPEHFDVAITVAEVNYGVSPGDTFLSEPYAYVGPHEPRRGEFWNAPFGAAHPVREVPDLEAFFREGQALAG